MKHKIAVSTLALASLLSLAADEAGFKPLFNGKDLTGWEQKGGVAKYRVDKGEIAGSAVSGTPNSFLCTKKHYANFILEYEFKAEAPLNSGVQVRSNAYKEAREIDRGNGKKRKVPAGRVHGYQVEIDPNQPQRMWTGGVYDEARRGWLYPGLHGGDKAKFTKQGQRLYKAGDWNRVRVECRGDQIRTWLNGGLRADFKDALTPKGFIGLQVHGIGGKKELVGATIRWRNLRIKELP